MTRFHLFGFLLGFAIAAAAITHGYDQAETAPNPLPRVPLTYPE